MKAPKRNCVRCLGHFLAHSFQVNLAYFMELEAPLSGFPQGQKGLSPCPENPLTMVVLRPLENSSHCCVGPQDTGILVPFFLSRPMLLKHLKPTGRMYYVYEIQKKKNPIDRGITILKENKQPLYVLLPKGLMLSLRTQHGSFSSGLQHPPSAQVEE